MIIAKVTSKGRVTIPKEFRERLGVHLGTHALVQADCILSRDLGVHKTYFSNLTVIDSIR